MDHLLSREILNFRLVRSKKTENLRRRFKFIRSDPELFGINKLAPVSIEIKMDSIMGLSMEKRLAY